MQNKGKTPQRLFGSAEQFDATTLSEQEWSKEDYALVWRSFLEAVGASNYFSGKIHTDHNDFYSTLTTSVIIYRDKSHPKHPITAIIPIWWEMATFKNGEEVANDFSFHEFSQMAKEK